MDLEGLRTELDRRANLPVRFHHWDPFILGEDHELRSEMLPAGEVARQEAERWQRGRFPSVQLAVADAVFSKVREYATAVRSCIRPFAQHFGVMALEQFAHMNWPEVFTRVFGRSPASQDDREHHHLSDEGRIVTTVQASAAFLRLGLETPAKVRAQLGVPGGEAGIRSALYGVPGLGDTLQSYLLMNMGRMTLKADRHVIAVLAPFLGILPESAAGVFERTLQEAAQHIGRTPFVVDQIVWYTEARSARSEPKPAAPREASSEKARASSPEAPAHVEAQAITPGRLIVANVIDIQPNKDSPTLELRFSKQDARLLPTKNNATVALTIDGVRWIGTIGITATNPPYVHTNLIARGSERSMTDLLRGLGVKERGRLEFEVLGRGDLRLVRVIDRGAWRDGNTTGVRALF